jgi:hypothetical protein
MSPSRVNAASLISPSSRILTASPMAEMSTKIRRCMRSQGCGWMIVNPRPNMETSMTSQSRHIAAGSPSMWQKPLQAVGWRGARRRYSMLTPLFPDRRRVAGSFCCFDQMNCRRLGGDEDVAHDAEHGGDGLFGLGEADELNADAYVSAQRRRRVLDLTFEANVHAAPVAGEIHRDGTARQFGGIRMVEGDSETEHGDVDDPAIAPTRGLLPPELIRSGPACGLAMQTAAILHDTPSVPAPSAPLSAFQAVVSKTCRVTCDCGSNARLAEGLSVLCWISPGGLGTGGRQRVGPDQFRVTYRHDS